MAFSVSWIFQAIDKYSPVSEKIRKATTKVESASRKAAGAIDQRLSRAMAKVGTQARAMRAKFVAAASQVAASAKKMGAAMQSAGASMSLKVTAPIAAMGAVALAQSAKMETLQVAFETMLGSADKAKKLTEDLTRFTATTPFQLEGVAQSAKTLLAFKVTQEEMLPTLRMLGDIASGTNAPLADIAQIFGKVRTKGKAMTEEILQLAERGIPIIDELADTYGATGEQVLEAASKGQISFAMISKALKKMTSEGGIFAGQTEEQSKTLSGLWSTMRDNFRFFAQAIGDVVVELFGIKGGIAGLNESLKGLPNKIRAFSKEHPGLVKLGAAIVGIVAVAGPLLMALGSLVVIAPLVAAGAAKMGAGIAAMFGPIGIIIAALAALVAAGVYTYMNWEEVSDGIDGTIEQVGINFDIMVADIKAAAGAMADFLLAPWRLLGQAIDDALAKIDRVIEVAKSVELPSLDDITGKVKGLFSFGGGEEAPAVAPPVAVAPALAAPAASATARADVNVNLRDPGGSVQSVERGVTGDRQALNLGLSMAY